MIHDDNNEKQKKGNMVCYKEYSQKKGTNVEGWSGPKK
jgi:hypothetical protein